MRSPECAGIYFSLAMGLLKELLKSPFLGVFKFDNLNFAWQARFFYYLLHGKPAFERIK